MAPAGYRGDLISVRRLGISTYALRTFFWLSVPPLSTNLKNYDAIKQQ